MLLFSPLGNSYWRVIRHFHILTVREYSKFKLIHFTLGSYIRESSAKIVLLTHNKTVKISENSFLFYI